MLKSLLMTLLILIVSKMKYLIVGLGNPGEKYQNTRHNIGFRVVDKLASFSKTSFESCRYAELAKTRFKQRTLFMIKPTTFMNVSGKAVSYWLIKEKIPIENLLVVSDDISIPYSFKRLKTKGSDGGHNGLKHIIDCLETSSFARLRIGVGSDFNKGQQSNYVLGEWSKEEESLLEENINRSIDIIHSFIIEGADRAMNKFNNK